MDTSKDNPIPDQLEILGDRIRQVARGHRTACAADGPPGIGKTFTLTKVAAEEGKPCRIISTTAGGLVQMAFQYRDHPLIGFDDFDKALRNEATANIVKQMTAPEKVRRITHQTVKAINNANANNPKAHIAPPQFNVRCGLVMLTNVPMSDPNAIDKDMREHVKALQDRGLDFIHVSRDLQHIAEYVMWLAEQNDLLKKNGIDLTATAKRQLSKFFMDNLTRFETVSVRRYLSIAKDRLTMPDRWKRLQEASFKPLEAAREPSSKKKNSNDGDPLSSNKAPITWKHQSDEWGSPQDLFDYLNGFFNFDVDVSASAQNAKCSVFWTKDDDGLKQDWIPGRTYWMNPPYSNAALWVKKATEASLNGAVVVGLLANRSSTNWYKEYVVPYAQIVLLNGRAKFVPGHRVMTGGAAPFASALAIWPKSAAKVLDDLIEPANVGIMSLKDAA